MKTVKDVMAMLAEYPPETPIYECQDAGGAYYFPEPVLRLAQTPEGQLVLVLVGDTSVPYTEWEYKLSFLKAPEDEYLSTNKPEAV